MAKLDEAYKTLSEEPKINTNSLSSTNQFGFGAVINTIGWGSTHWPPGHPLNPGYCWSTGAGLLSDNK